MALVRLFGAFSEMAGWHERTIAAATLGELRVVVGQGNSDLAERLAQRRSLVIVNQTLTPASLRTDALPIAVDDEVAFGPPVSGG